MSKLYGVDSTTAKEIIRCESHSLQSARNYNAAVGVDVGLWQINTYYHQKEAARRGLDIFNWEGNLEYGFQLLKEQGTTPWNWSKYCWNK